MSVFDSASPDSPSRDPEVIKAISYLVMREVGEYTMQQIADEWEVDRGTVYNRYAKWKKNGVLKDATDLWLQPKIENIQAATADFISAWPLMIKRLQKEILYCKSPKTMLEMMAWAKENIVDPETTGQEQPGSQESAYARRKTDFNPTIIATPAFLKKLSE